MDHIARSRPVIWRRSQPFLVLICHELLVRRFNYYSCIWTGFCKFSTHGGARVMNDLARINNFFRTNPMSLRSYHHQHHPSPSLSDRLHPSTASYLRSIDSPSRPGILHACQTRHNQRIDEHRSRYPQKCRSEAFRNTWPLRSPQWLRWHTHLAAVSREHNLHSATMELHQARCSD
jgi:hypothetical protein